MLVFLQLIKNLMTPNVCVCAVVGFRSRHCQRGQTLNEDNTLNLHVTPPLRKHFVVRLFAFVSNLFVKPKTCPP
jgi:hypothetical protein